MGEGMRRGRARGLAPCLQSVSVQPCPPRKGTPHRAQRPGQRGKAQEHGDWGHKHPPPKPRGAGKKGDYKSQETTKLNTKVGTAGEGRGVGEKSEADPGLVSRGA